MIVGMLVLISYVYIPHTAILAFLAALESIKSLYKIVNKSAIMTAQPLLQHNDASL